MIVTYLYLYIFIFIIIECTGQPWYYMIIQVHRSWPQYVWSYQSNLMVKILHARKFFFNNDNDIILKWNINLCMIVCCWFRYEIQALNNQPTLCTLDDHMMLSFTEYDTFENFQLFHLKIFPSLDLGVLS